MKNPRSTSRALAVPLGAAAVIVLTTAVAAQYALDRNQRINTQLSGVGAYGSGSFGGRNLYAPGVSQARSPYTVSRGTGNFTYSPNQAFGQPLYRPTGYAVSGGSAAYQRRFRYGY
jgi:hypothetical protein